MCHFGCFVRKTFFFFMTLDWCRVFANLLTNLCFVCFSRHDTKGVNKPWPHCPGCFDLLSNQPPVDHDCFFFKASFDQWSKTTFTWLWVDANICWLSCMTPSCLSWTVLCNVTLEFLWYFCGLMKRVSLWTACLLFVLVFKV